MSFLTATSFGRAVIRSTPLRAPLYTRPCLSRYIHASGSVHAVQRSVKSEELVEDYEAEDMLDYDFDDDDTTSAGHLMLREQRQTLHYLRLIEHEMPKLVGTPVVFAYTFKQFLTGGSKRIESHSLFQRTPHSLYAR